MSESDTNPSTATLGLEPPSRSQSTFNTPAGSTPYPKVQLSDETISLLNEVSSKLKTEQAKPQRPKVDPKQDPQARKRKRTNGSQERPNGQAMHLKYPEALKPFYLKAKGLYIKKLNLATSIYQIGDGLLEGKFPAQTNFRSSPPTSDNESFKTSWMTIVNGCKRNLTSRWVDELNRKYAVIKSQIHQTMTEMEAILDQDQFRDIKQTLNDKYKLAAPGSLSKKAKGGSPTKKPKATTRRDNPRNPKGRSNRQVHTLLKGLAELLKQ